MPSSGNELAVGFGRGPHPAKETINIRIIFSWEPTQPILNGDAPRGGWGGRDCTISRSKQAGNRSRRASEKVGTYRLEKRIPKKKKEMQNRGIHRAEIFRPFRCFIVKNRRREERERERREREYWLGFKRIELNYKRGEKGKIFYLHKYEFLGDFINADGGERWKFINYFILSRNIKKINNIIINKKISINHSNIYYNYY